MAKNAVFRRNARINRSMTQKIDEMIAAYDATNK